MGAHGHQVVNFFHWVGVLASIKQLRKCASDSIRWVLQGGSTAEDMGEEVCAPMVLPGYRF